MRKLTINDKKLINRFDLLEQELKSIQRLLESKGLFEKTKHAQQRTSKFELEENYVE